MAERIEHFTVTATAGTLKAAPVETPLIFQSGIVTRVEIVIPTGHAGLTGFQICQAHQAIIPRNTAEFITSDGEVIHWPLDGFLNTGNWQLKAFNTDVFDHAFYLRFLVDEIPRNAQGQPVGLTADQLAALSAGEGGSQTGEPGVIDEGATTSPAGGGGTPGTGEPPDGPPPAEPPPDTPPVPPEGPLPDDGGGTTPPETGGGGETGTGETGAGGGGTSPRLPIGTVIPDDHSTGTPPSTGGAGGGTTRRPIGTVIPDEHLTDRLKKKVKQVVILKPKAKVKVAPKPKPKAKPAPKPKPKAKPAPKPKARHTPKPAPKPKAESPTDKTRHEVQTNLAKDETERFNGVEVAAWIHPLLEWAHNIDKGWDGSISSGWRSNADQLIAATNYSHRAGKPLSELYPNGIYASNHCGKKYPKGAVDTNDWKGLHAAMSRYPGSPKLVGPIGLASDPYHFSHDGH